MTSTTNSTGRSITIHGAAARARVRKVETRKGARLEIESPDTGHSLRIDPLALESITWQDEADIGALDADLPGEREIDVASEETDAIRMVNEFADATVERVETDGGEFLDVTAPKLGYSVRLAATDLIALAQQDPEQFSEFLSEPFGPIEGDYHGPPG